MPTALINTPESIAEIGDGADECASGNHAWKGIMAALRPNPLKISIWTNR
jgi:hypothetical protein